ncbi:TetR/AcrR family transcriptional regulator [Aquabacter sp. P-9]|uniref:TetR/AcrR family transcriptional regulator n=1 Tax=Aquabacter sediminis TaxID=3029197 RepID=UPI00237DB973|nr:TetR/AcrR family transcriptional regulator [Aquabacter sp. P-9]MDE1570181.1 TetR/AcrR family transcriptional regulator [Aquabacter sp. P-9]
MATPFRTSAQRQRDREEKRFAVMRAATRLFNERGFHATSLDDVAARLGVTKPTIYHYLGNKDQVLLECVTFGLDQVLEAAERSRAASGNGLARLQAFLRRFAEINMDDFGRCVIRTGDEVLSPESAKTFRALKGQIDRAMRALVAEGIADGSIAPGDPRMIAFTLAGALNWPARWFDPNGPKSSAEVAAEMVEILTRGIAGNRDAAPAPQPVAARPDTGSVAPPAKKARASAKAKAPAEPRAEVTQDSGEKAAPRTARARKTTEAPKGPKTPRAPRKPS